MRFRVSLPIQMALDGAISHLILLVVVVTWFKYIFPKATTLQIYLYRINSQQLDFKDAFRFANDVSSTGQTCMTALSVYRIRLKILHTRASSPVDSDKLPEAPPCFSRSSAEPLRG